MTDLAALPPLLILGGSGLLGTALTTLSLKEGLDFQAPGHKELDLTVPRAVEAGLADFVAWSTVKQPAPTGRVGLVINAAAYTNVDAAEENEELAFAINAQGAATLAAAAARHGLDLIHLSTDYVFDGCRQTPYDEDDAPRALNVYGRSKLAGEQAVLGRHPEALIVRTSWLFGPGRPNFVARLLDQALMRLAQGKTTAYPQQTPARLEVVADQRSCPTSAAELARGLLELYRRGAHGLFHLAGAGSASRYELAQTALSAAGLQVELVPVNASNSPARAPRPPYSVLDCEKAGRWGVHLAPWRESLSLYVRTYLQDYLAKNHPVKENI